MPTQQYHNLFGSSNNNNNNNKSHSPAKSTSSTSSKSKSQSPRKSKSTGEISKKLAQAHKPHAATSAAGPAKPKTLEQALRLITPDDFAAQVAQVKISCPGSELRWLSSVSKETRLGKFNAR